MTIVELYEVIVGVLISATTTAAFAGSFKNPFDYQYHGSPRPITLVSQMFKS